MSQDFYIRARQGAGQPEYVAWSLRNDRDTPPPLYTDLADCQARAATKTQATVRILLHHCMGGENSPALSSEDIVNPVRSAPLISPSNHPEFRAVIFTQFPFSTPPLIEVSSMYIECAIHLTINRTQGPSIAWVFGANPAGF
jgi:hypothetical protein